MIPHSRPTLAPEDARALLEVIEGGQLSQGPRVAAFEDAVARMLGRNGGVAVSSGTAALALALAGLGAGPGDEVVLPAYACSALGDAVRFVGAKTVLADVNPDPSLDPEDVARRVSAKTRAVVVVHPFGQPVDVEPFLELDLPVVEDCAQALGASFRGRPVGARGAATVCSFYATKLVAAGEGGMVVADDGNVLGAARELRLGGRPAAFNFKLSDLAAALGLAQLERLEAFVARRRQIARRYDAAFSGTALRTPVVRPGADPVFARYIVRVPDARDFIDRLGHRGVEAKRPVGDPLLLGEECRRYPEAARAFAQCVSLPLYPNLSDAEMERVVSVVCEVLSEEGYVW